MMETPEMMETPFLCEIYVTDKLEFVDKDKISRVNCSEYKNLITVLKIQTANAFA